MSDDVEVVMGDLAPDKLEDTKRRLHTWLDRVDACQRVLDEFSTYMDVDERDYGTMVIAERVEAGLTLAYEKLGIISWLLHRQERKREGSPGWVVRYLDDEESKDDSPTGEGSHDGLPDTDPANDPPIISKAAEVATPMEALAYPVGAKVHIGYKENKILPELPLGYAWQLLIDREFYKSSDRSRTYELVEVPLPPEAAEDVLLMAACEDVPSDSSGLYPPEVPKVRDAVGDVISVAVGTQEENDKVWQQMEEMATREKA